MKQNKMYMKLLFYHIPLVAMHFMSIYSLEEDNLVGFTCCYIELYTL